MANPLLQWAEYPLQFAFTARTSRETMTHRRTYLIRRRSENICKWSYGECNFFDSLAPESHHKFMSELRGYCAGHTPYQAIDSSAVRCGIDMLDFANPHTEWTTGRTGIPINGLIWMDSKDNMRQAIADKLNRGFKVLKLKIGGINFEDELDLIKMIRRNFVSSELEIRLDANGSFSNENALERLERLAAYDIHSIEQPIKAWQWSAMAHICTVSPIAIALDEELIGLRTDEQKHELLRILHPHYIIIKPTLCGGLRQASRWIDIAEKAGIDWWLTSALESNIGLTYLAAFVSQYANPLPQGLGTGQIYSNNIPSSLRLDAAKLWTDNYPGFDSDLLDTLDWK